MKYLSPEQILFIHFRLIEETSGGYGIRDMEMLLSAAERPKASFDGRDLYPDPVSKTAALMESLIRNHPFIDGNKRAGVAAAGLFLLQNGYRLTASNAALADFALGVAQSRYTLAESKPWLHAHIQPAK